MIVVDLGCAPHGADVSIEPLVKRFSPDVLYGFDPILEHPVRYAINGTHIEIEPTAAWTEDGFVGFVEEGLRSRVFEFTAGVVPCFDLAEYLRDLTAGEIVCKMDVEGAEHPLVRHLCETGADELLSLLIVEWHCAKCGTGGDNVEGCKRCGAPVAKIGGLRCPVEEWS